MFIFSHHSPPSLSLSLFSLSEGAYTWYRLSVVCLGLTGGIRKVTTWVAQSGVLSEVPSRTIWSTTISSMHFVMSASSFAFFVSIPTLVAIINSSDMHGREIPLAPSSRRHGHTLDRYLASPASPRQSRPLANTPLFAPLEPRLAHCAQIVGVKVTVLACGTRFTLVCLTF